MAITIPTLDAPRVDARALPTPQESTSYSPNEFAAGAVADVTGDIAKVAAQFGAIKMEAKRQADEQVVASSLNDQRAFNDAGLERVRRAEGGKNAAAAANAFYDEADKEAKRIYGTLTNDQQRLAFTQHANAELTQARKIGESHVGQQILVSGEINFKAGNDLSLKRVANFGADLPNVIPEEVEKTTQRVADFAKARGIEPDAAKSLLQGELSKLYLAPAHVLIARHQYDAASALLAAHQDVLGEEGAALLGKVETARAALKADDDAITILNAHRNPDQTFDETKALDDADKKYPAGVQREALRKAISERSTLAWHGRQRQEGEFWDKGLGLYMAQSTNPAMRSVDALRQDHPNEWMAMTPDQRNRLEEMQRTARQHSENEPLSPVQLLALGTLENDIASRSDYWGTAEANQLTQRPEFAILPERYQIALTGKVAEAHRDRQNPDVIMKSAESALRDRAQANGILSDSTRKKSSFDKWDESDQVAWRELQDRTAPLIVAWKTDPANKGKRIPNAVVEGFVDDVTRQGSIKNGKWFFFDKAASAADAAKRPVDEQAAHPFTPDIHTDEAAIGREVLRRQGYDEKATPAAYAPESLIAAARAWRSASAGPGPQERATIEARIRGAGKAVTPEAVQAVYEAEQLKYVR